MAGRSQPTGVEVVIIDDEGDFLDALAGLIEASYPSWSVTTFLSPEDALDALEDLSPELVITDYRLPRIDGFELIEQARGLCPGARFVLATAFADSGLEQRAAEVLGEPGFLYKGGSVEDYLAVLDELAEGMGGNRPR